jgi:hypothetical protein
MTERDYCDDSCGQPGIGNEEDDGNDLIPGDNSCVGDPHDPTGPGQTVNRDAPSNLTRIPSSGGSGGPNDVPIIET